MKKIDMKKIKDYDSTYALIKKDAEIEVYGTSMSHKRKDYADKLIETISIKEFLSRQAAWRAELDAEAEETKKRVKVQKTLTNWVETLPDTVNDYIIDKSRKEVCDPDGNYMFGLPFKPVADFNNWLENQLNEYYTFCE